VPKTKPTGKAPPAQQRGLGKAQRALIAGALPWALGIPNLPGQVRLSAREQQNRPAPFVPNAPKKGRGKGK
jgi:hypothetical protein